MLIIKLITIFIGTIILINDVKMFTKTKRITINFGLECVIYFFYYIPLICDLFIGRPTYKRYFKGFIESYSNFETELIYCLIIIYILYIFHKYNLKRKDEIDINFEDNKYTTFISLMIFFVIIGLLVYIVCSIDNELWKEIFSYNMRNIYTSEAILLKNLAFVLILMSLIFIVIGDSNLWLKTFLMFPIILFAFFLNGKRTAVFLGVFGLLFIVIIKKMIKNKYKLVALILFVSIMLGCYIDYYGKNVTLVDDGYTSYRINFGRDDTLKMTIYRELNNNKILEYRGQTMIFYFTFFIRRSVWKNKPFPFATYFTASLVELDGIKDLGWNMTTSIFDETIANFGFIGIIFLPFIMEKVISFFIKRNRGILGKEIVILGAINLILLIAVQASAFIYFYILHILLVAIYDIKNKIKINNK